MISKKIKCQQCLSELQQQDDSLHCNSCNSTYQIYKDMVFMGYAAKDHEIMQQIIAEESEAQTNLDEVENHYAFAKESYKIGMIAIQLLKENIKAENPTAIDIGSGGAPFSGMLCDAGFDTYRLELDPNSLYSGLYWKHDMLGKGQHIVADASIIPFADNSVDVVFCKEFIHHIDQYHAIFKEINRVLKPGGLFLLMEPTKRYGFLRTQSENEAIDRFGHHIKSIFEYHSSLKQTGFSIDKYYLYYESRSKRIKLLDYFKRKKNLELYNNVNSIPISIYFNMQMQRIVSGENIIYAKKSKHITPERRPEIRTVDTDLLKLGDAYMNDPRLHKFEDILTEVSEHVNRWDFEY